MFGLKKKKIMTRKYFNFPVASYNVRKVRPHLSPALETKMWGKKMKQQRIPYPSIFAKPYLGHGAQRSSS